MRAVFHFNSRRIAYYHAVFPYFFVEFSNESNITRNGIAFKIPFGFAVIPTVERVNGGNGRLFYGSFGLRNEQTFAYRNRTVIFKRNRV